MKITLLSVGKTDYNWIKEGMNIYISRLKHYINFNIIELAELKKVGALSKDQIKEKEGELILNNIKDLEYVVLLDERGKEFRSLEFGKYIQDKLNFQNKDIVFVIGGAYGFSKAVYNRSDDKISLSKMTFSHQMIRAIFVEQLYRAFTIIKGEPYHHE